MTTRERSRLRGSGRSADASAAQVRDEDAKAESVPRSSSSVGLASGGSTPEIGADSAWRSPFRREEVAAALPLITVSQCGLRFGTLIGARQSSLADALVAEGEGGSLSRRCGRRRLQAGSDHQEHAHRGRGVMGEDRTRQRAEHGAYARARPLPHVVHWGRRGMPGALVLFLALVAAAWVASPAAATSSRLNPIRPKDRFRPRIVGKPQVGVTLRATRGIWTARPVPPEVTSYPTVSGTAQEGQTLTAGLGTWSGTQPINYAYQWQRCQSSGANCAPIAGATATTYTLTAADVGSRVEVSVTASNLGGSATASSPPTAVVVPASLPPALVALWHMEFQQPGQASCGFEGTSGYAELVAGPAINDGHWHTISCVKTSTMIQVVVDGQTFSKAATIGSISNTTNVAIGARPGSDWYQGQLDEASVQIG